MRKTVIKTVEEIKEEVTKSNASSVYMKQKKACMNITKNFKKRFPKYTNYNGVVVDGVQIFTDNYSLIALTNPIKPLITDNNSSFNYKRFIPSVETLVEIINVPDILELKQYVAMQKNTTSKEVITYDFGKSLPLVNAEYLINIMDGIPNGKLYTDKYHKSIYAENDNGDMGVLLGLIRK